MAKKEKKKYQKKYTTGGRVDMRKGGRVKYQLGRAVEEPREEEMSIERQGNNTNKEIPTPSYIDNPPTNSVDNRTITKMPEQPNPRDEMIFANNQQ